MFFEGKRLAESCWHKQRSVEEVRWRANGYGKNIAAGFICIGFGGDDELMRERERLENCQRKLYTCGAREDALLGRVSLTLRFYSHLEAALKRERDVVRGLWRGLISTLIG